MLHFGRICAQVNATTNTKSVRMAEKFSWAGFSILLPACMVRIATMNEDPSLAAAPDGMKQEREVEDEADRGKRRKIDLMNGDVHLLAAVVAENKMSNDAKPPTRTPPFLALPPGIPMAAEADAAQTSEPASSGPHFRIPAFPTTEDVRVVSFNFDEEFERVQIEGALRKDDTFVKTITDFTEGSTVWSFSKSRSELIKALLEATKVVDKHETGLHYYELDSQHGIDRDVEFSPTLITRPHSRGVVDEIEKVWKEDQPTVSYIVGPPGVGKTRSLQLLLRRFFLSTDRKPASSMRYYSQKEEVALWILVVDDKLCVYVAPASAPKGLFMTEDMRGTMFHRSVVLLDPKEARKGGAEFVIPRSHHLVIACSANENHFPVDQSKVRKLFEFYLGL